MLNERVQKAGDNSVLNQNNIIINNDIESYSNFVLKLFNINASQHKEVSDKIDKRLEKFSDNILKLGKQNEEIKNNISQIELTEPRFYLELKIFRDAVISTDDENIQNLIARLLIDHIKAKKDLIEKEKIINTTTALKRVDYKALCALTLIYFVFNRSIIYQKLENAVLRGKSILSSLEYTNLPEGQEFVNHLDSLGLLRIAYGFTPVKFDQILLSLFNVNSGILYDSENYKTALELINKYNLSPELFIKNPFDKNHLIINRRYPKIGAVSESLERDIIKLYDKNSEEIKKKALEQIKLLIAGHKCYSELEKLIESMNTSVNFTSTGKYLSELNLARLKI